MLPSVARTASTHMATGQGAHSASWQVTFCHRSILCQGLKADNSLKFSRYKINQSAETPNPIHILHNITYSPFYCWQSTGVTYKRGMSSVDIPFYFQIKFLQRTACWTHAPMKASQRIAYVLLEGPVKKKIHNNRTIICGSHRQLPCEGSKPRYSVSRQFVKVY